MKIPDSNFFKALGAALMFLALAVQPAGANSPIPIHAYELNNTLADSLGGPALIAEGGTIGATSYAFGPNQGVTLVGPNLTNPGDYSIELVVTLDTVRGPTGNPWVKLIDYRNLTDDRGLYSYDGNFDYIGVLQFYPYSSTTDAFYNGVSTHVVITRDDTSQDVTAYALGVGTLSFTDNDEAAVVGVDDMLRFLQDDFPTNEQEATSGSIDFIRIYDRVLTAEEVAELARDATTLEVDIDVKPGSDPNSINLCSHGTVPVAIFGSDTVDVSEIDTDSLRFSEAAVKVVGKKDPHSLCSYEDVNGDSVIDLVCHFVTIDLGGLDGDSTTATVNGELVDGTPIEGVDSVNIVKDSC